jgi:hypothetical protein
MSAEYAFEAERGLGEGNFAGPTPIVEFSYIDAAVASLGLVDPGLRAVKDRPEVSLGEAGFFTQDAKKTGDWRVTGVMLGLGCHSQMNFPRDTT